jgi:hypothetical protein
MKDYAEFNINDSVKVRLTDLGRKIHRKEHERIFAGTPHASKYTPPKEDADGYSIWQLWILMDYFGEYVGMARELPFETTILIAQSDIRAS